MSVIMKNIPLKCRNLGRTLMLLAGLGMGWQASAQQDFSGKPIRVIVPYAPGGATTILARLVGERLSKPLGQSVLVDNRPGGNTVIGSEALVRAPADGHTLLLITSTHVINPLLMPKLPYDAIRDFAPVSTLAVAELILAINSLVPADNLKQLIALARAKPGTLNYASAGAGGTTHLAGEYFNILAGVKTLHVPYKGTAPSLTDLVAGQVDLAISPPAAFIPFVKAGKLKALAVTGDHRLAALPQVPTFREAGLPEYELRGWYGILAPSGTPGGAIERLSGEIAKILALPDISERLVSLDMNPFISTPAQFAALIKSETAKFANIIKTADIKYVN